MLDMAVVGSANPDKANSLRLLRHPQRAGVSPLRETKRRSEHRPVPVRRAGHIRRISRLSLDDDRFRLAFSFVQRSAQ